MLIPRLRRAAGNPQEKVSAISFTDPEAEFTALVQRQARFVFRVAYAVLLNAQDAEDAAQETFLKLYRNPGWRQADNERAYLARAAWRTAIDLRARLGRARTVPEPDGFAAVDAPSPEPGPEQTLLVADRHAHLHALIDALPEELRVPLVLASFDELNSRAIGAALGVPEGTIRTRLQRARLLLREKFAQLGARAGEVQHD